METSTFVIDLAQRVWPDFAQLYLIGLLACIDCKSLMQSRSSSLQSLLPFCYPTAQYGAGQGSTTALAGTRKDQLIQTYQYGIVGEGITVAEFRVRCFQPLSHLSGALIYIMFLVKLKRAHAPRVGILP